MCTIEDITDLPDTADFQRALGDMLVKHDGDTQKFLGTVFTFLGEKTNFFKTGDAKRKVLDAYRAASGDAGGLKAGFFGGGGASGAAAAAKPAAAAAAAAGGAASVAVAAAAAAAGAASAQASCALHEWAVPGAAAPFMPDDAACLTMPHAPQQAGPAPAADHSAEAGPSQPASPDVAAEEEGAEEDQKPKGLSEQGVCCRVGGALCMHAGAAGIARRHRLGPP